MMRRSKNRKEGDANKKKTKKKDSKREEESDDKELRTKKDDFIPSAAFAGPKKGYVFSNGKHEGLVLPG